MVGRRRQKAQEKKDLTREFQDDMARSMYGDNYNDFLGNPNPNPNEFLYPEMAVAPPGPAYVSNGGSGYSSPRGGPVVLPGERLVPAKTHRPGYSSPLPGYSSPRGPGDASRSRQNDPVFDRALVHTAMFSGCCWRGGRSCQPVPGGRRLLPRVLHLGCRWPVRCQSWLHAIVLQV